LNELEETIENIEDGSVISDVLKDSGAIDVQSLKTKLKDTSLAEEDCAVLEDLLAKKIQCDEYRKTLKNLKEVLEEKVKKQYPKLTDKEILELLVNRKWYQAVYDGIDALYTAISHTIANRVTELTARYEEPLPVVAERAAKYEVKVKSHLEKMGFVW
jgi:type I restriction enzyme M protein